MARHKRVCHSHLIYHVINRGNNRQAVFLKNEDYEKYLGLLYRFKEKMQFKLFSFCLMTNHIHLLVQAGENYSISQFMQSLTNAHTLTITSNTERVAIFGRDTFAVLLSAMMNIC